MLTTTIEYISYQTDATKYNLEEQNLDVIIKFEVLPTTPTGQIRSWDAIEDKYGRLLAYQAAHIHPFTDEHYGNTVGELDSSADFYLNPRTDGRYYPKPDEEHMIEIEECNSEEHFAHLDPVVKEEYLENGKRRCLNMKEKEVSGGTVDKEKEHLIILRWQHCEELREEVPGLTCATPQEQKDFFDNVKVKLEIGNTYIDYSEKDTENTL